MKQYPPFPRGREDIFAYTGPGEYLASAIVKDYSIRQLMAFRKLRLALGEADFREALVEALDILSRSTNIHTPKGFLYDFIRDEALGSSDVSEFWKYRLVKEYVNINRYNSTRARVREGGAK